MSNEPNLSYGREGKIVLGKPPPLNFEPKSGSFLGELDGLQRQLQNEQRQATSGLKLNELSLETLKAASFDDPAARALRSAHALIEQKNYREALPLLGEALQAQPNNLEVFYLIALCETHLGEFELAIQALFPLLGEHLHSGLAPRVQALRIEIRNAMTLLFILGNVQALRLGQYNKIIPQLQRLIALDPEGEIYYYLLGGTHMMANRLDQARETLDRGLSACGTGANMLVSLKQTLVDRTAAKHLEPVRAEIRRNQLSRARERFRKIPTEAQQSKLGRQFDRYFTQMELAVLNYGKPSKNSNANNYIEVEDCCFYLIEEDMQEAKRLCGRDRYRDAEKILLRAIAWTPSFPYASYLYAGTIYARLLMELSSRRPPNPNEVRAALQLARQHAVIGTADPQIEEAGELLEVIEQAQMTMDDADTLEPLMHEYIRIMDGAKKGVRSMDQLRNLQREMTALLAGVTQAAGTLNSDDGREQLGQLVEAIERNLDQLTEIRASADESDSVDAPIGRFRTHVASILKRGGLHPYERAEERRTLEGFKEEMETLRREVTSAASRSRLQQEIDVIDQLLNSM